MPTITIEGIISNDELRLSDGGYTCANKGAAVFWRNGRNSGVEEFEIVEKSGGEIWRNPPYRYGSKGNWKGVIKGNARDNAVYDYSIFWRIRGDKEYREFDPKIAVLPSGSSSWVTPVLLFSLTAGLVTFSYLYFSLKRKHKRLKQQQMTRGTTDLSEEQI